MWRFSPPVTSEQINNIMDPRATKDMQEDSFETQDLVNGGSDSRHQTS